MAHTAQIQLEAGQFEAVQRLASERHCTVPEVLAELVRRGLERQDDDIRRRLAALDHLAELGERVGPVPEELLEEIRAERDSRGLWAPQRTVS